ncbi:MAG: PspC domain-containing protein [Oscillospiraceae bacterium]|nr:PspC domain-containing protein [Oscillospiraceae bacterium]
MNKLMKCESDRKICGVCSGVARYLNIDTTVVRLIWAILCLSGFGIAAYIIAALIMPSDADIKL